MDDGGGLWCTVRYDVRKYRAENGEAPVEVFLKKIRLTHPDLHALVVSGMKKIERGDRHGPPLTEQVDKANKIFELRVGYKNIARVFFFFQRGRLIYLMNGYVKKAQKVDDNELQRARDYKKDWEERTG